MPLGLPKAKNFGIKTSDKVKTSFTKTDVERSLKMSNLGKMPKGSDGTKGQVGKKVKAIDKKVDDIDDIYNPKV